MREAKQAIAHAGLIHELLDPNVAKFPREHAAAREIERLRDDIERLRADKRKLIDQLRYIRTHLYAATVQRSPADDRIIADHIEQAYLRTNEVIMEMEKTDD